jgi:hypothetical protein
MNTGLEAYCPGIVLFLGGFLTLLALASLSGIYKIMIHDMTENKRVSFVLALIGVALMAVSRL